MEAEPETYESLAGPAMQLLEYTELPQIDSSSMSARFRICTSRPDREGDVIEPSGVDWSDYQNTGVVKYEHGFTGIPLPIAKSIDENGLFHVTYDFDEDAIYARAFHSENDELSAQMFGLVEEGFLRAASIHVIPVRYQEYEDETSYAQTSHMLEWSECTVGINPDTYAKALVGESKISEVLNLQLEAGERILSRGTIGGRSLLPTLAKCLKSIRPERQATSPGIDSEEGSSMSKKTMTKDQVSKLTPIALAKAVADPSAYDADSMKLLRHAAKSLTEDSSTKAETDEEDSLPKSDPDADSLGDETTEPDVTVEDPPQRPLGADVISAAHEKLDDFVSHCEEALKSVEKPETVDLLTTVCEMVRGELATLEGGFASIYPDQDGLAATDEAPNQEMVKCWVSENQRTQFQLDGLASRLKTAMKSGLNGSKAKSLVGQVVRDLGMLNSQAKSYKPKDVGNKDLEERVNKIAGMLDKLLEHKNKQPV